MNEGKIAKDASQQESFRYVNCELTVRPEITALQTNDGTIVEDNSEIVEVQFDFFSTVYTSHKGEQMPEMKEMITAELCDSLNT